MVFFIEDFMIIRRAYLWVSGKGYRLTDKKEKLKTIKM
jgi:hypothetical protein